VGAPRGERGSAPRGTVFSPSQCFTCRRARCRCSAPDPLRQPLVDVSIIARHDGKTGIQRVVSALLGELYVQPLAGFIVRPVEASRRCAYRYSAAFDLNDPSLQGRPVAAKAGDIFLGLDFTSSVLPLRQRDLLEWRRAGVKLTFIVYDLLPVIRREWFTSRGAKSYRRWLRTLVVHADALFCISASVEHELHQLLRRHCGGRFLIPSGWFHLGSDLKHRPAQKAAPTPKVVETRNWHEKTVLMVGTIEPRKGYVLVLDAFEHLWRNGRDVRLVIVGGTGWSVQALVERIKTHPEAGQRLVWLEKPDDEVLLQQYLVSDGLLMASEGEGFGLPLVEGARHRLPVLARDLPVFQEIGGTHITYFAGNAAQTLATEIDKWLHSIHDEAAPDSSGMTCLSWSESAAQLRSLLQSAISGRSIGCIAPAPSAD
jgi:glycosyltransferase involved in cell wall biosynthesis